MPDTKYVPHRKCIACRNVRPKEELIRVVLAEGGLVPDPQGKLSGRGCYVCRNSECIRTATEKNCFSRSFKKGFSKEQMQALKEELNAYIY